MRAQELEDLEDGKPAILKNNMYRAARNPDGTLAPFGNGKFLQLVLHTLKSKRGYVTPADVAFVDLVAHTTLNGHTLKDVDDVEEAFRGHLTMAKASLGKHTAVFVGEGAPKRPWSIVIGSGYETFLLPFVSASSVCFLFFFFFFFFFFLRRCLLFLLVIFFLFSSCSFSCLASSLMTAVLWLAARGGSTSVFRTACTVTRLPAFRPKVRWPRTSLALRRTTTTVASRTPWRHRITTRTMLTRTAQPRQVTADRIQSKAKAELRRVVLREARLTEKKRTRYAPTCVFTQVSIRA